ncbi:MAG: dihydropteroate synthase [Hyphomicrobiaceae bacterium]
MTRKVYLRPAGLIPADRSLGPGTYTGLLPLCGSGPFDFTALEVIRRDGPAVAKRLVALGEVWESGTRSDYLEADEVLDRLTRVRRRVAGLDMTRPQIMGVVNVTPDSFSDGGRLESSQSAIAHGLRLAAEGASILDIGGESTRPGSDPTPVEEELARVIPVIEGLAAKTDAVLSIDTRKAEVMRRAVDAGARMINDVSALSHDPEALEAAADLSVPVVLMHALGDPKTMQDNPRYDDVLTDVYDYLESRIAAAEAAGIARNQLIVDPGIGFGKTLRHNLELMAGLALFHGLGVPVLLGASRKRWIGMLTQEPVAAERVIGSAAAAMAGVGQGLQIVRVHDVKATRQALAIATASWSGHEPEPTAVKTPG